MGIYKKSYRQTKNTLKMAKHLKAEPHRVIVANSGGGI